MLAGFYCFLLYLVLLVPCWYTRCGPKQSFTCANMREKTGIRDYQRYKWCQDFTFCTIQRKSRVLVSLFLNKKTLVRWTFCVSSFKRMVFFLSIPFERHQLECVRAMAPGPFSSDPCLRCNQKPSLGQGPVWPLSPVRPVTSSSH